MQPPKVNYSLSKAYTLFSAAFLVGLICVGTVLLAERFEWRWLGLAGVLFGGMAILTGGAGVVAMFVRNFRR